MVSMLNPNKHFLEKRKSPWFSEKLGRVFPFRVVIYILFTGNTKQNPGEDGLLYLPLRLETNPPATENTVI